MKVYNMNMEYVNRIFNEDCVELMRKMIADDFKVDLILTSPPYNIGAKPIGDKVRKNHVARYDVYIDRRSSEEYRKWCVDLFDSFDKLLSGRGVVLWNVGYGNDGDNESGFNLVWLVIADLIESTNFCVADRIVWKKRCALPNNVSPNKLTRIVEDIFVFCRKREVGDFHVNKKRLGVSVNNQNIYENVFNYIEAVNNDGSNEYNKATFSSELVVKLLKIYAKGNAVVYDPFMGTGTTAVGAKKLGLTYVGSEISRNQCEYAEKRLLFDNDVSRCNKFNCALF